MAETKKYEILVAYVQTVAYTIAAPDMESAYKKAEEAWRDDELEEASVSWDTGWASEAVLHSVWDKIDLSTAGTEHYTMFRRIDDLCASIEKYVEEERGGRHE